MSAVFYDGFKKAERSADFPVGSNPGTFYGSEKLCNVFFWTMLRTGKSTGKSALRLCIRAAVFAVFALRFPIV